LHYLISDLLLQRLTGQHDDQLYKGLYSALYIRIIDGSLKPSSGLPACRDLAQMIALSLKTLSGSCLEFDRLSSC